MKFDLRNRVGPAKVIRHRDGRECVFDMPCVTDDPVAIELLSRDPLVVEVPADPFAAYRKDHAPSAPFVQPAPPPPPPAEVDEDPKPKPSRKEV
jgi:hypothetical protein